MWRALSLLQIATYIYKDKIRAIEAETKKAYKGKISVEKNDWSEHVTNLVFAKEHAMFRLEDPDPDSHKLDKYN